MARRRRRAPEASKQTVLGAPLPASVGGWNACDALAVMPVKDAVVLDNFIPRAGYIEARRGCVAYSTGNIGAVQTMLAWRGGGGSSDKVFAASGTAIYDANVGGDVLLESGDLLLLESGDDILLEGAAVVTGLNSPRIQYINFANNAGNYLIGVTGSDVPIKYDGATWGTTAITVVDPTTLIDVMVHKRRLWFTQANTLCTWYLPTDAIAGAATKLDLGPQASLGGTIAGAATWTLDGGNGPDDYAVWVTTNGQVIIYKGTDPASADTWELVGTFMMGIPLGRRALLNYGAELILLTHDGAIPLSQALSMDRAQDTTIAITAKIQNAFALATRAYGSNFGWEAFLYPAGQLAIYNVPVTPLGVSYQYVQNVQTGAWCRFTGLNAFSWVYANGVAYFGGADGVYQWDTGSSDNGTAITCDLRSAYNGFGAAHRWKQFTMIRPLILAPQNVMPALDIVCDYADAVPTNVQTITGSTGVAMWDVGLWDVGLWADETSLRADWTSTTGCGYVGAARMRVVLNPTIGSGVYPEIPFQVIGFDLMYQPGGML